jgi:LuxR family maltose regulon positive regulatory protein
VVTPLLTTKLYIPPVRPELVSRQRLIEQLNAGLSRRLMLVSAPAGYGKTTLLSDWAHRSELRTHVAWVSLDKGDNDPVIFWDYFATALKGLQAGAGENASALLRSPQPPPIESVLTTLVNEVSTISDDFTLVLDDYHLIESQSVHSGMSFLLDHLPPQMHLVIATRADPSLPLSRLRGRGAMIEIRADDLRFTLDEATVFLKEVMGLSLTTEDLAALETRTEGWVTGLQMAVLSMQGRKDIPGFIAAFTGSHRYILDYLVEEVFQRQPANVQDFLLKTSILDRLTAPLCDFVTERDDSRDILLALERANLFIVPLDESRQWYRYEHLFADLLQHQLDIVSGVKDVSLLHARASQWHEINSFPADAVRHAIAAQDWKRAATLIHDASDTLLKHGEVITLLGWIQALPDEVTHTHPELCRDYSWALILTGQIDSAESYLGYAEQAAKDAPTLLGEIIAMQAYIARAQGNDHRTIELSEQALSLLPQNNLEVRCIVALNLGIAQWHSGQLTAAEQALNEANHAGQQSGNDYVRSTALSFLGAIQAARGKLHWGVESCQEAIGSVEQSPVSALSHILLGALLYEWNDLKAATDHIQLGIQLSQLTGNLEIQIGGYRTLARIRQAQDDNSGALEALQKAHQLAHDNNLPLLDQARNAACHVQVALTQGDLDTALHWAEQVSEDADASSFYPCLNLTQARLLIAQNRRAAAAKELEVQYERVLQAGWQYGAIETLLLQALAAPETTAALAFLTDALRQAQPEGYIRTFVDKGELLVPLLREAKGQRIAPDYVAKLLTIFEVEGEERRHPREVPAPSASQPLAEPLSERELEVLRLLAAGLSNREIAKRLIISIGTAKTHVHNILSKLNASGRIQAIARAKELDLI